MMENDRKDLYSSLDDMSICELLKKEDGGAWKYILEKVVDQEKRSSANSRKRKDWGVPLDALVSRLYNEMVGERKLDAYCGRGSLVGWLRKYLRGYLNRENPNGKEVSIDEPVMGEDREDGASFMDVVSFEVSDFGHGRAYGGEDDQILRREEKRIARQCFRELWLGNSMQAYVMLLKARFQMSSLEIKERLGVSSADNVDQIFARAVKKMREVKEKYEN